MKYKFKLNHLDCVNCANNIENKLKLDKNIKNANVNFSKLTINIETDMEKGVKEYISKIVNSVETNTKV